MRYPLTAVTLITLASLLASCASYQLPMRAAYHPSLPPEQQAADRAFCEAQAKQITGYDPAGTPAKGAALGAVLGGALGTAAGAAGTAAAGGNVGRGAALGAVLGGFGGGLTGAGSELARLHELYTKQFSVCMRAKGYLVE